ncbi:hypothetical protein VTH06DRAFT_3607 [Thermothelomyces fergusii]
MQANNSVAHSVQDPFEENGRTAGSLQALEGAPHPSSMRNLRRELPTLRSPLHRMLRLSVTFANQILADCGRLPRPAFELWLPPSRMCKAENKKHVWEVASLEDA